MKQNNQEKFSALREFNLPNDQYAIIGSGPLGIRNIKAIGDIDIIVTPKLLATLAEKYGITDENGVKKSFYLVELLKHFGRVHFIPHKQMTKRRLSPHELQVPK